MRAVSYILILFAGLSSCNDKKHFDTEAALWQYIQEKEGYVQHKNVNGVDFTLTYRPTDLLVKQHLGSDATKAAIDSLRGHYGRYMYFNLAMAKDGRELLSSVAGNRNRFGAMVNRLAFGMDSKVRLYSPKKDTIPLVDYIYPRMYGASGSTAMLFVYPRDKNILKEDYLNFTIEDIGFYTGEVRFKIPTTAIKNEPGLHFKNNHKSQTHQ